MELQDPRYRLLSELRERSADRKAVPLSEFDGRYSIETMFELISEGIAYLTKKGMRLRPAGRLVLKVYEL